MSTTIIGKWYEEGSAAQQAARLQVSGTHFTLEIDSGSSFTGFLSDCSVSDRIGNIERKITFNNGSVFTTADNDAIDQLPIENSAFKRFIYKIESHMAWVVTAIVITLCVGFSFFKWGLPWLSYTVAESLPHKTNEILSEHTFQFLDQYYFDDTLLASEKQQQLTEHFHQSVIPSASPTPGIHYQLHFRQWNHGDIEIANALALPSGDIILTDKFIELSQAQDEIDAVLFHEIGHIEHRHGLKMAVQNALLVTVVTLVTGDVNALADIGIGLGTLLVNSHFSRIHESEADDYAFKKMLLTGIDPDAFSQMMRRISDDLSEHSSPTDHSEEKTILDYFSSHPDTQQRIEQATRYSQCFQQGLKVCDIDKP